MDELKRFVNRDVESIRASLYDVIREKVSAWTDFNSGGFESHIIDLQAGISDMLCYYIDNAIQEVMLMSARQDKNIRGILETMNYPLEVIGAARGTLTIERVQTSLGTYSDTPFTIPKWTTVRGGDDDFEVNYVTTEVCSFLSDDMEKEVPIVQGDYMYKDVRVGDLKKNYKYYFTADNVPIEWVFLDDISWEKVDDAFIEIEGGKKYSVHKDSRNRLYIMFTYDWKTYLSQDDNDKMRISFIRTEGTAGLMRAYSINQIVGKLVDDEGEEINKMISVYNKDQTYGAYDKVDLNLHKANAKRAFRTMNRIILRDDFEGEVRKKPWILNCTVYDWRRDYTIVPEPHKMVAWVVTTDGVDTNQKILDDLRAELMEKTVDMTDLQIKCAEYVNIPVEMNICVKGNNDYREQIRRKVEDVIKEAFDVTKLEFGQIIAKSDIEDVATRVAGTIRFPEVQSFNEPFILSPIQFPCITKVQVRLVGDIYGQKTDY